MTTKRRVLSSFASLAALALAPGCSLPRGVTSAADVGLEPMDAYVSGADAGPPLDARASVDAGVDAYAPGVDAYVAPVDAYVAPVDAYVPPIDAYVAPIDAYVPPVDAYVAPVDAWVAPVGDASTPCDRAYGGAPGYRACGATSDTTCVFYVNWPGASSDNCARVCGGRCVSAIGNVDGTMCSQTGGSFPCDQTFQDAICTCTP